MKLRIVLVLLVLLCFTGCASREKLVYEVAKDKVLRECPTVTRFKDCRWFFGDYYCVDVISTNRYYVKASASYIDEDGDIKTLKYSCIIYYNKDKDSVKILYFGIEY